MTSKLGFLGTGWIGRHRMAAMLAEGATAVAVCDPAPACRDQALALAPGARAVTSLDEMLSLDLDGIVIATPSALHAEQSITALEAGAAVFCQKPLGRSAAEARAVVAAARVADRLLGLDLSYRHTAAMRAVAPLVRSGALGRIFAIDCTFHNAYGPDKPWFQDPRQSGGGCVIDLGVHLVDLALWTLDFPAVRAVNGRLLRGGCPLRRGEVEDYAAAQFSAGEADVRLTCSWHLNAGREAVIEAAFYGTTGGAALRNVGGSFYDFIAERFSGTTSTVIARPPDSWGGRAAAAWVKRLGTTQKWDPEVEHFVRSAEVVDSIYAAGAQRP